MKGGQGVVAMEFETVALERWLLTPGKERKIKIPSLGIRVDDHLDGAIYVMRLIQSNPLDMGIPESRRSHLNIEN
jgi:hypothetical protein